MVRMIPKEMIPAHAEDVEGIHSMCRAYQKAESVSSA